MIYLPKFNNLYNQIINEQKDIFSQKKCTSMHLKYFTDQRIKQCLLTEHCLDRVKERFYYENEEIVFKNIGKMLDAVVNDKKLYQLIEDNEYKKEPIEIICSTRQFNNKTNWHLVIPFMVSSNTNMDYPSRSKFYFLTKTAFPKNEDEYKIFVKQGLQSTNQQHQIPINIQGEDCQYNINQLFVI